MNTNFQSPNLQREIIRKKLNYFLLNFHQLIYSLSSDLTKFETPSCYSFRDIMNTNFQSPNLQREIIQKK